MPFTSPTGMTDKKVIRCIERFIARRGWPPTVRELGECLGISTTSTAYWLNKLAKEGKIVKGPGARAIQVKK